jgi:hypothetical protein
VLLSHDFISMYFSNKLTDCDYFSKEIDSFAVLLKGSSLDKLSQYHKEFNSCFIVSDYDDELIAIGKYLKEKDIAHFTNRSKQSSLSKTNYQEFNIKHIQTGQVFRLNHFRLMETYLHYKRMMIGLKVHSLPEGLLRFHNSFGSEYALKFPNTGILSLIYTLEIVKPKVLWIFGLDFYSTPYMMKQSQGTVLSLEQQQSKLNRLNLPEYVSNLFQKYPETKIMMVSYYTKWPEINNMKIIK